MSLQHLQKTIDEWVKQNGGYWDELSLLARLTEEVGELAREYNHRFGAKKKKATELPNTIEEEMGDLLWLLICMANQQQIDLDQVIEQTMLKITHRDSGRYTDTPSDVDLD